MRHRHVKGHSHELRRERHGISRLKFNQLTNRLGGNLVICQVSKVWLIPESGSVDNRLFAQFEGLFRQIIIMASLCIGILAGDHRAAPKMKDRIVRLIDNRYFKNDHARRSSSWLLFILLEPYDSRSGRQRVPHMHGLPRHEPLVEKIPQHSL